MAKKIQYYVMPVHELLAKQNLLMLMVDCHAIPLEYVGEGLTKKELPRLYWNVYYFYTDGETWFLNREYYREGTPQSGFTCYPHRFEIKGGNMVNPALKDYTYEEITEMITSEIERIPNKND